MLNVLLWYVLVNRLSQVNISMQSYLGKYLVYAGLCTEMNYKIKFPFMWSMGFTCEMFSGRFQMCFFFFFFQMCLWTWKNDLRTWKYKLLGIYTQDLHPHKQTAKPTPKKRTTFILCINSSVESFNEEFFTKSKLHDHFVDFNFFQKEVLKLQNQILKKKGILM